MTYIKKVDEAYRRRRFVTRARVLVRKEADLFGIQVVFVATLAALITYFF